MSASKMHVKTNKQTTFLNDLVTVWNTIVYKENVYLTALEILGTIIFILFIH